MATNRASVRDVALLAVLSILPYLNAVTAGFSLDDIPNVRENPAVIGGVNLTEILASPMPLDGYGYRPFTVLSFAVNEGLAPGNAAAFHAVNLLLHASVTLLVFSLALRLFDKRVAVIAATLFAIHPIHTEAVTSVVGRAELLAALFALLSLLSSGAIDAATDPWSRRTWHGLSVLCFAIALLSKESAVVILPLIVLYRVTRRGEPLLGGAWKEVSSLDWVPYALCFGTFMLLRFLAAGTWGTVPAGRLTPLDNALAFVPWDVRVRSALGVVWDYFALLNFPLLLSADYSYNQVPLVASWLNPRFLGGASLVVTAAAVLVGRKVSPVRFAAAFPLVALIVTANLLFPIGTIKAERLLYLPSVGWALVFACAADQLISVRRYRATATAGLLAIVAALGARTWIRNWDWKDDLTLAESMARSAPDSVKARCNFGVALQRRGEDVAAEVQFRRALEIMPRTEEAAFGMGLSLDRQGSVQNAMMWYRKALEIAPGYTKAHQNLCRLALINDQFQSAVAACRNGLRYSPANSELLKGLGVSLVQLGDTEKGVKVLRRALRLNRHDKQLQTYVAQLETTAMRDGQRVTVQ